MRVSLEWLADFVDVPPQEELCERLAAAGVPVDGIHDPRQAARGVIVGEVESVEPHPEQGVRVQVCSVFDGTTRHQVICGAPNVATGLRVPFAPVGTVLPGGMEIGKRNIRGVDSEGMLCSRSELGLEERKSAGLWELPLSFALGRPVMDEAKAPAVFTLDITPNRPDLLSHVGVAREVAASSGKRLKATKWRVTEKGPEVGSVARVLVEEPTSCRRYVARVVRNLRVGPSPAWLRERLESLGQRCINNVVDATNYVLHELGHPLHAFDLSRLAVEAGCPTVRVRLANEGERLKTLDGVERTLTEEDLVIADANRAVALAGVMGGLDSEVTESTVSVLLESAYFDPARVRAASKRHGLRSEASLRFERGTDPGGVVRAVDRCAQLLAEIADGEVAKGLIESSQKMELTREIPLRLERVPRLLGVGLGPEQVAQLLEPLEIRVTARTEDALIFQAPSFRPDLTREVDLIEEVARRHGYDRIPERVPGAGGDFVYAPMPERVSDTARSALLESGCSEAVTYGMASPGRMADYAAAEGEALRLMNPLGEELSALRTTLLPGLLAATQHNVRHGCRTVRLFEVGTIFHRWPEGTQLAEDERDRELPREDLRAACVLTGGRADGRWYEGQQAMDFSDLRGVVESLLESLGLAESLVFKPAEALGFNKYCSAELWVGPVCVGKAGRLSSEFAQRWGLEGGVFAAEVSLQQMAALPRQVVAYQALPRFPKTRRDLAVVAERSLPAETLREFLQKNAGGALGPEVVERVWLFDVYTGKPVPPTHVSLAFGIDYRNRERTLTDEEVGTAFQEVLQLLTRTFPVEVRQ